MSNYISKSELLGLGSPVICINYCKLQTILNRYTRAYYTGSKHWDADVFAVDYEGTLVYICTGKSPSGTIEPPKELNKKYDNKAKEISRNTSLKSEYKNKLIDKLLKEYVREVLA